MDSGKDEPQLIDFDREFPADAARGDDEFALAGKVAQALAGVIKACRCYAPAHPLLRDFEGKFYALLTLYLQCYETLTLSVGECHFATQGRTIYTAPELKGSIPFLLYRDGIRELRLLRGVSETEVQTFLAAIRQRDAVNALEDDLVTLLWERELLHIEVHAVDSFLEGVELVVCETPEDFRAHQAATPDQLAAALAAEARNSACEDDLPNLLDDRELYRLTPEDQARLRREVQQATAPDAPLEALEVLFDMVPLAVDADTVSREAFLLRRMLDELFLMSCYPRAAEVLFRLHALCGTLPSAHAVPLRQVLTTLTEAQWYELLRALTRGGPPEAPRVARLILLRPAASLPAVLSLLDDAGAGPVRKAVDAALLLIGQAQPDLILQVLEEMPRDHLDVFARLAGELALKRAVPFLGRVLDHPDPRVRVAAVDALGCIGGAHAVHLVAHALLDARDTVRCQAAAVLGHLGDDIALQALLAAATAPELAKRTPAEIRAVLSSLSHCPQPQARETLRQLAKPSGLFQRGAPSPIRDGAQRVLAAIDPAQPVGAGARRPAHG